MYHSSTTISYMWFNKAKHVLHINSIVVTSELSLIKLAIISSELDLFERTINKYYALRFDLLSYTFEQVCIKGKAPHLLFNILNVHLMGLEASSRSVKEKFFIRFLGRFFTTIITIQMFSHLFSIFIKFIYVTITDVSRALLRCQKMSFWANLFLIYVNS